MTRRLLSAAVLLFALNGWAADPWQKPYKQWDAQDVRQILNNSPWSKAIEAEPKDKKNRLEAPEGAPAAVAGGPRAEAEDAEDENEKGQEREREETEKKTEEKKEEIKFLVRWVSSRTLREASVRGQVLQGKIPEADADKNLPPTSEDYEVALVGADMSAFNGASESTLRDKTYLVPRKSKQKVPASQVEIVRAADGKRINAIVFHFPKTNATGQLIISTDEKELQFFSRGVALFQIKATFDVRKMIDSQGMDL